MCHENKEWCKIWKGTDLSFQNWNEKFDECWPGHSKMSKICTLIGCFWPNVWAKKNREVMFDGTEYWCKTWKKIDFCFQKWHEEFSKLSPEHVWKSKNWDFDGILLSKVEIVWA